MFFLRRHREEFIHEDIRPSIHHLVTRNVSELSSETKSAQINSIKTEIF